MSQDLLKAHQHINNLIQSVLNQNHSDFLKYSVLTPHATHIIASRKGKAKQTLQFMINSFNKSEFTKAINHAKTLERMTSIHANDFPFEIGDHVAVIREEHGWHDGRLHCEIISRSQNKNGIWSYDAQSLENNPYTVQINHTRDAIRI